MRYTDICALIHSYTVKKREQKIYLGAAGIDQ